MTNDNRQPPPIPTMQLLGPLPPNLKLLYREPMHFTGGVAYVGEKQERLGVLQFSTKNGVRFYVVDADMADQIADGLKEVARTLRSGIVVVK